MDSFLKILPMIAWAGMVYVMIAQYGTINRLQKMLDPNQQIILKEHLEIQKEVLAAMRKECEAIEAYKKSLQDRVNGQAWFVWQLKKRIHDAM